MRIQHNIPAMSSYRNYTNNTSALAKNLEKLSSGYKINRAGDDAAGLAISEKMRAQITGLEVAQKNAKDGISLVQTAEGALTEVHSMLNRMYELAEQSANGTYADEVDREQLQKEVDQLRTEINRIADSSNFNGIKLLDGSLSSAATATKIDIGGIASSKSQGAKGVYCSDIKLLTGTGLYTNDAFALSDTVGNTFSVTVALDDGTSHTVEFTMEQMKGADGKLIADKYQWVTANGDGYPAEGGTDNAAYKKALLNGVLTELGKTKLSEKYSMSWDNEEYLKFTALKEGTDIPEVAGMDYKAVINGQVYKQEDYAEGDDKPHSIGMHVETEALSEGREIAAANITEYDGSNYDDAVFTINGKKFVVLTNTIDTTKKGTANKEYLRAVAGLGDDVTILVGGTGGLMKPAANPAPAPVDGDAANNNFEQNCKAIEEATGLKVTDAIGTAADPGGPIDGNTIHAGTGIRLSIGTGTVDNSLMLQIGDTAESFNQLKVSIKDCHAKAMGIGEINIGTQEGASAAMDKIKNAINYVSDVRGTLGATQNRLDHTINNLSVMQENIQDAESTIRDVDVAKEMMEYTKNNILVQSAQAMLAQANQLPQGVLQLLQ